MLRKPRIVRYFQSSVMVINKINLRKTGHWGCPTKFDQHHQPFWQEPDNCLTFQASDLFYHSRRFLPTLKDVLYPDGEPKFICTIGFPVCQGASKIWKDLINFYAWCTVRSLVFSIPSFDGNYSLKTTDFWEAFEFIPTSYTMKNIEWHQP